MIGKSVHGWLLLDKPEGITSAHALSQIKRHFGIQKLGHAGTLDPLAQGVLPIALNEATKTMRYVVANRKGYVFTVCWGEARDTRDREGIVTAVSDVRPMDGEILAVLPQFLGNIMQMPPKYSALKINGVPAYQKARQGEVFDMSARPVEIFSLQCVKNDEREVTFNVVCGKGTYVRSLAVDLAYALGTCGHVTYLRRTFVGRFHEKNTISLANLLKIRYLSEIGQWVEPIGSALDDILAIPISDKDAVKLKQGKLVTLSYALPDNDVALAHDVIGVPVALVRIKAGFMQPVRVFNMSQHEGEM